MSSSALDATLPMNTLLQMITIKLTSSNYLLWKNQILPMFSYQNLISQIDGSSTPPKPTIVQGEKSIVNPLLSSWMSADQRVVIILHASLTKEASAEIIGLSTGRSVWFAVESAYNNSLVEHIHNLCD